MLKVRIFNKSEAFETSPSITKYALQGAAVVLFAMLMTLIFMS